MTRKILLTAASAFLTWQSFKLIGQVGHLQVTSWFAIVLVAWIMNMFVTGVFAFAGFAWPTQHLLPEEYYRVRNPKLLGKVYRALRVDLFRKFLLATLWRGRAQRTRYFDGRRGGLARLVEQSEKSEFGHLLPLLLLTGLAGYVLLLGQVRLAVATQLINLVGNFYPVVLQRYHRMRVARLRLSGSIPKRHRASSG